MKYNLLYVIEHIIVKSGLLRGVCLFDTHSFYVRNGKIKITLSFVRKLIYNQYAKNMCYQNIRSR